MTTSAQYESLRYDFDMDNQDLTNDEIDALYVRAAVSYPDNTLAQDASVRLLVIRTLLMQSARLTDYTQNRSTEKFSQVFDHLLNLRKIFADDLVYAVNTQIDGVRYGGLRRTTPRIEEYPDPTNFGRRYWISR